MQFVALRSNVANGDAARRGDSPHPTPGQFSNVIGEVRHAAVGIVAAGTHRVEGNIGIGGGVATHAPRIHDQWTPDEIRVEHALNADTVRLLENMGHKVARKAAMGSTQSIMVTPNGLYGASDPRIEDAATVGY